MPQEPMIDSPVGHSDRVGGDERAAGDPAGFRECLPCAALHRVERSAMELEDTVGKYPVAVRAADIDPLALALDELFDFPGIMDFEWDCIRPAVTRN
jgi:hypothetical protein